MKKSIKILCFVLILNACKDEPSGLLAPQISIGKITMYKNNKGNDSIIKLSIKYSDNDGDLGLSESDTQPPFNFGNEYFYNLKIKYLTNKNGIWQQVLKTGTNDTINFNQRFKRLNESKKKRKVYGEFEVRIPASPYPGIFPDSVRMECMISDRSLHKSNFATTDIIILKH
ncbi:MAG: hypothetical protein HUU47_05470 [Bacteroidetes bacterium]|nr:hypothetical protein [Bacteroidota bacterium]